MSGPIVSFICWNRSGLTARNLKSLLNTSDDFELHIIDCNSKDYTWDFIKGLKDNRIVEKKRLVFNLGAAYAINYVMAQRKPEQFFIHFDSDTCMLTSDWVTKFMNVMNEFPEVGAACTVDRGKFLTWKNANIPFNHIERNNISIEESGGILATTCVCIRPECIDKIGYFNEETCVIDLDYAARIVVGTKYKHAFVPDIVIDETQKIECENCEMKNICKLDKTTCFNIHDDNYQHPGFLQERGDIFHSYLIDIQTGARDVYCASIHDEESLNNHYYNREVALGSFRYFVDNGN